ncbi:MAG: hypothetical protein J6R86_02135 [Lentisphaeria bacterium]|nr:hypothetical protein [Lentisphaeria bacterium]
MPDDLRLNALQIEEKTRPFQSIVWLSAFFILFFAFWIGGRELFRQEGLYATCAHEFRFCEPVSAHGIVQPDVQPLFPAVAAALNRAGVPMEWALRLVSIVMLGAWSLLAASVAARRRNYRAGVVTFLCCTGTIFAMGKGIDGVPATMSAFFLLAGQLSFFHFGSRLANWNKAWLSAALLWILAFLSGGPAVLLYCIVPIFFLRRPLSVRSKFNAPGFFIACAMLIVVVGWRIIESSYSVQFDLLPKEFSSWDNFKRMLVFPWLLPVRFFPWSLLMWLPFCAALQAIDQTPVLSKYLRTVFAVSLALMWIIPGRAADELFFLIGPLAIMTGLNYELGIRRYRQWFAKALWFGEFVIILAALAMAATLLPNRWLAAVPFINSGELIYREGYSLVIAAALILLAVQAVFFHLHRAQYPVWHMILKITICFAIFCNILILPSYITKRRWRSLGGDISSVLPPEVKNKTLYKLDIDGMYCGLFYAGVPVKKIRSLDELPSGEDVYLIASGFPRHFGWRWSPLLPPDYRFEGEHLTMWRGVPVPPEEEEDIEQ